MNRLYLTAILTLLWLTASSSAAAALPGRTDNSFPLEGSPRVLVILAEYDGTPFNVEDPFGYFNGILTQDDFTDYFCKGSCRQYFQDNSNGKFTPQFDVYGPVVLPKKASYYGENLNNTYDTNAHEIVIDACTILNDEIDFSLYDADCNGVIDNVFIVYAGYGEASGGGADTVWPHAAYISKKVTEPIMLDGIQLDRYACVNEMEKDYPTGIGTFCHEFSHVLGLPDIYPTDQSNRHTAGRWDLMDHGSLNGNQRRPCNLTAYERGVLGWLDAEEIATEGSYTLPPLTENRALIIPTASPDEFFLLENRQQMEWDKSLPGHGLLVWHIDYQEEKWMDNTVNNDKDHPCVSILKADGVDSEGSENGDPFPGTTGKINISFDTFPAFCRWNGENLGIAINDISENADKTISFRVEQDANSLNSIKMQGVSISGRVITSPAPFTLTDISGHVLGENLHFLTLPDGGIYILRSDSRSIKLIVK